MFMHQFYTIVTVFSIQFSVLCFPLTMMHLQLAGFQEASLCKNFPGRAAISAPFGSTWIVLLWADPVQTLCAETEAKGSTLSPRSQVQAEKILADFGAWSSPYPVPFSPPGLNLVAVFLLVFLTPLAPPSPHTWELNQDSPFDPLVLDNDWLLASRVLLWSKLWAHKGHFPSSLLFLSSLSFWISPSRTYELMFAIGGQIRAKWTWIAEYSESWPLLNHMLQFVFPNFFFDPLHCWLT